jgi:hypothetical protein
MLPDLINSKDKYMQDGPIRLIKSQAGYVNKWQYLLLRRNMECYFDRAQNELKLENVDLDFTQFGTVLKAGLGVKPDEETVEYISNLTDRVLNFENAEDDCTPLHLALKSGHSEVALLLIQYGADVQSRDHFGLTPLHLATIGGDVAMCMHLLDNGADITATDVDNHTALDLAETLKLEEIALVLSSYSVSTC